MAKKQKTIGILGGLGPEASNWLAQEITRITPASKDQDHLKFIYYNNPKIPDRTDAIVKSGESPVLSLVQSAEILEEAGADFIVIPCNTSHYYIRDIQKYIHIPIINMIEEVAKAISINFPKVKTVGLLATTGTVTSGIYDDIFSKYNIEVLTPTKEQQEEYITEAIYGKQGVKAGYKEYPRMLFEHASDILIEQGAQAIIAGCTEVGLSMEQKKVDFPIFDSGKILAHIAVNKALNDKPKNTLGAFGSILVQPYYFIRRRALELIASE